jgi:hypothetical protein
MASTVSREIPPSSSTSEKEEDDDLFTDQNSYTKIDNIKGLQERIHEFNKNNPGNTVEISKIESIYNAIFKEVGELTKKKQYFFW